MSELTVIRVECSRAEAASSVVFSCLEGVDLPERARKRLAADVARELAAAGFFDVGVEQHFSATRVAELLSRSPEYVVQQLGSGAFGPVGRDGAGWLIPSSVVVRWLLAHQVAANNKREVADMGANVRKKRPKRGIALADGRGLNADCADRTSAGEALGVNGLRTLMQGQMQVVSDHPAA